MLSPILTVTIYLSESGSEKKERELKCELTRSHSRSRSFLVPGAGLEPAQP